MPSLDIHLVLDALILIVVVLNSAVGGIIFLKQRTRRVHALYFVFVVFLNLWIIANFFENEDGLFGRRVLELFLRLDFVLAIFIVHTWFLFCDAFREEEEIPASRGTKRLVAGMSLVLAVLSLTTNSVVGETWFESHVIHFENGPLLPLYAAYTVYLAGWGLWVLLKSRSAARKNRLSRRVGQIDLMLIGFFISIGTAMFINLFLQPVYGVSLDVSRIGLYGMSALAFFVGYAIVRHRLFDIKIVIQRGVIFLVLLVIIVGIYLLIVGFSGYLFHRITNATIFASAGLTAIIGIFGVGPVERFVRHVTDRFFFEDTYDYAAVLRELSEALGSTIDPKKLIGTVSKILESALRIEFAKFALFSHLIEDDTSSRIVDAGHTRLLESLSNTIRRPLLHEELRYLLRASALSAKNRKLLAAVEALHAREEIGLIVPIVLKKKVLGAMLLGKKRSGDGYREPDIKLLHTFSHQAAIAFSKADLYRKVKEYSEELEARVLERTNEIRELQEEQRQIMIDLSHGLQTPLTVAKGELEFLKKKSPGNKKLEAFERSIDEVSKFIYDLLRFSSLENHLALRREQVNFSMLVEEVIEYFRIVAEERNIEVIADITPGITISGDRRRLEELLTGLVSNAMKYMKDRGERRIRIKLSKSGSFAELSVADTGVGIASEDLRKVFTRFYRSRHESAAGIKGVGLGLAIAKRIAERHGGSIRVESVVGKGSTFFVTLPLSSVPSSDKN